MTRRTSDVFSNQLYGAVSNRCRAASRLSDVGPVLVTIEYRIIEAEREATGAGQRIAVAAGMTSPIWPTPKINGKVVVLGL